MSSSGGQQMPKREVCEALLARVSFIVLPPFYLDDKGKVMLYSLYACIILEKW
jgi:hypothetical protein